MQYELRVRKSVPAAQSDTDKLPNPGRGILLGLSGDVKVGYQDGTTDVLPSLAAGVWHPMEVYQVFVTGTDVGLDIHIGW